MMETDQTAASCHAPGQTSVKSWLSSNTRGAPSDFSSRFQGDGVRYKAKLIGMDPVPDAQGHKMCWDSMMKLKGFDAVARKQGKHKQRVWLKLSSCGLRIVDERTGAVLHDHDRSRISSLTKDESDPRALAYVYQHQDTYCLFYIKMANLADPVLVDIEEVCKMVDQETSEDSAEAPTQTNSLFLINDSPAAPAEGPAFEGEFSPRPDSSSGQSNQASSSNELMEVFSIQMEEPLMPDQSSCSSQPESPHPTLSASQILSMFPTQPAGGSPYSSPPYSPTSVPWGQQGLLGNQWAGQAAASWPTMPGNMAAWAPAGIAAPPAGGQILAHGPQPGFMTGGNSPASPTAVNGYPSPFNSFYAPAGATAPLQSVSPTLDQYPLL
ncbi:disabled homolog 1-like [Cottoperca gobio]|uniref:Disabled homolog 1-like n=1 Tax=Cottoperca gobio TaxID=56716 RepID=A0A6J2PK12_COTGO|nr:disabled homolog 1-like [Cottoperca gobio]